MGKRGRPNITENKNRTVSFFIDKPEKIIIQWIASERSKVGGRNDS